MKTLTPGELVERYRALSEAERREVSELVDARSGARAGEHAPGQLSHRAIGRLVFEHDGADGRPRPMHHVRLRLWDVDAHGPDDFLGEAETDADGRFEIRYDPASAGRLDDPDLKLRLCEPRHVYRSDGTVVETFEPFHTILGERNVTGETFDFGTCRVPYWEYDPRPKIPRLLILDQGTPPTAYAHGRSLAMLKSVTRLELAKDKHLLEHRLDPRRPSLERIQRDYPENLTRKLEKKRPGYTRGDEYFGLRVMNGMGAGPIDRDPADPSRFWIHHHWNSYEHDGEHALPDVDLRLELREDQLWPVEITLHLRAPGATEPGSPTETLTFTPRDGDRWQQAKRVARVSAALAAELDTHLTQTHLNVEQYAIAAWRNLRKSPVRRLLFPHLKEVVLINHGASTFLLGASGYITRASALTAEAIDQRIAQTLGTLDWYGFEPAAPISDRHLYARAARLFWEVLTAVVESFFDRHGEDIRRHWLEVHRFSSDLVEHSVPAFLCRYLAGRCEPVPPDWLAREERMALDQPRHVEGGVARAVRPITGSDSADDAGIANLKQVCRYLIFLATFKHSWSNSRQYDDGGEILYNGLGLRYGENGVLAPESDLSISPPPDRATELLWISGMLSFTRYGTLLHNEEHDVYPALVAALRARAEDFARLDLDVSQVNARINI